MFIDRQKIIIDKKNIILAAIILVIAIAVIFLGAEYFLQGRKIRELQKEVNIKQTNIKVKNFLDAFIKKVLKAENEVSFEDRLKLENSIRDLNDKEILTLWERFIRAQTSDQVQQSVKNLLEGLVNKILY